MKCSHRLIKVVVVLTLAAFSGVVTAADYELVVMRPSGYDVQFSHAWDLDQWGNVAGWFEESDGTYHGFFYHRASGEYVVMDAGTAVSGINNFGELVGGGWLTNQALYWSTLDAAPVVLPPLPDHQFAFARRISDAGIVVGWSGSDAERSAVAWKLNDAGQASDPIELPSLGESTDGDAMRINAQNANRVSVVVGRCDGYAAAVSWKVNVKANGTLILKSGPTDLGTLGDGDAGAYGVNANSFIVGQSGYQAFKKSKSGSMKALRKLKVQGVEAATGRALDVNDYKDVVGSQMHQWGPVSQKNSGRRAVLWPAGRRPIDLNTKVELRRRERLEAAPAINNQGDILVSADLRNMNIAGCLLIPRN